MDQVPGQPLFGLRLRALRTARGMSQAELGGEKISTTYLSRLESGARPPTQRVLTYLCDRLAVSPSAFRAWPSSPLAQALARVATVGETMEMATALEDALQVEKNGDAALRWQAQWLLARCYQAQGKPAEELRILLQLTELSDETQLPDLRARSRVRLARRQRASGEFVAARASAQEALALVEENRLPPQDAIEALLALISVEAESGQLVSAGARADQLLDTLSEEIPVRLHVESLWTIATVKVRQGDRGGAVDVLDSALGLLASNEDPVLWMRLRLAATSMHLQMDTRDIEQARLRLEEAASAAVLVGMPLHQRELLLLRAQLAFYEGKFDEALGFSDQLGDVPEGMSRRDQVRLSILRNQIAIIDGDRKDAVHDMERIAREAQTSANVELAAEVWRALAEALSLAAESGS
ncbi:helix-turn-helix domain-containing protein [Streptomyces sp. NPDC059914]